MMKVQCRATTFAGPVPSQPCAQAEPNRCAMTLSQPAVAALQPPALLPMPVDLHWEHGQLKWHDPETGRYIATYDDQVARAETAEVQIGQERAARAALEAQVRELKAQLQRPHS